MLDAPQTVSSAMPTSTGINPSASEKRRRWFEACLVLLVACGGYIVYAIFLLAKGPSAALQGTNVRYVAGIVHQFSALLLLYYVLSRRGLNFASIGLRWRPSDLWVGCLLIVISFAAYGLGSSVVQAFHFFTFGSVATGLTGRDFFSHPPIAAIPYNFLNPFFEELIVRAYLMTETLELTGSVAVAVIVSVLVQFSYHLYYGWIGAFSLLFLFVTSALYYAYSRRATPVVIAHAFFDLYALIRLW
jgi:membrane protease YdiL (CAAX protease family)